MKTVRKKATCIAVAAAVVTAAGLLLVCSSQSRAQRAPAGGRAVAVCNLSKIFDDYKRADKLNAELNERRRKIKAEIESRKKALETTRQQLRGLREGGEAFGNVLKKAQGQQVELQVWSQIQEQSLLRDHLRLTKEMFKEISDAIAAVAKKKGIGLVVQLEPRDLPAKNSQELISQLTNRKVLYNADTIDITGDVLRLVNERFVAEE